MSWLTVLVDFTRFDEAREGERRLLQRNVDLSVPENQNRVQEAWPGGWRRSPTLPGRTLASGMRPGQAGPGGGSRPRASRAGFPCMQVLASPRPDWGGAGGGQRRSLPGEESWGLSPLCAPTCTSFGVSSPKSRNGAFGRDSED